MVLDYNFFSRNPNSTIDEVQNILYDPQLEIKYSWYYRNVGIVQFPNLQCHKKNYENRRKILKRYQQIKFNLTPLWIVFERNDLLLFSNLIYMDIRNTTTIEIGQKSNFGEIQVFHNIILCKITNTLPFVSYLTLHKNLGIKSIEEKAAPFYKRVFSRL